MAGCLSRPLLLAAESVFGQSGPAPSSWALSGQAVGVQDCSRGVCAVDTSKHVDTKTSCSFVRSFLCLFVYLCCLGYLNCTRVNVVISFIL